jgi:hypothetical protein
VYAPYLGNLTAAAGALVDYVRITGAITPDRPTDPGRMLAAVKVIRAAGRGVVAAQFGCPIINSRPWWSSQIPNGTRCIHQGCPRLAPTDCNVSMEAVCEAAAVARFAAELEKIQATLAAANAAAGTSVELGAVLFDCEVGLGWDAATPLAVRESIARQAELTVNTTNQHAPGALTVLYGYGAVKHGRYCHSHEPSSTSCGISLC